MAQTDEPSNPLHEKLSMQQLDLLLHQIESLPTLPSVATRLLGLSTSLADGAPRGPAQASVLEEMAALISLDQSLTARLLAMANRASPGSVATVEHAVRLLGEETVRSVVLSVQVFQTFEHPPRGSALDRPAFCRHCLAVASATEMVAVRLRLDVNAQVAFSCGLLHDLGKLAAEQRLPKTYHRVLQAVAGANGNIADFERQILGVDHSIIGRRLSEHWQLPRVVQQSIWLHHQPWESLPSSLPGRRLVAAVTLADTVARELRIGFSGNYTFVRSSAELAQQIGLAPDALQEVVRLLPGQIEDRANLLGLGRTDSESIYREALGNANAELSRLNEQLRLRGRQLEGQAGALGLLRDFAASLSAQATVSDVLVKAAEILSRGVGLDPRAGSGVVVYSIHEEPSEVLALRLDPSGPQWRTLRRPRAPAPAGPGQGDAPQGADAFVPSESAAEAIAHLVEQPDELDEWVDVLNVRHRPLVCAKQWIGGALLPRRSPQSPEEAAFSPQTEEALSAALALALAIVQGRDEAVGLSEQIASASQVLGAAQDALSDAKTLATIGEMAAGAAHELNNPLAVISGRAQLMINKAANEEDRKTWRMIAQQSQRISDIITELMEFASPPAPTPAVLDAGDLLREAAQAFAASDHPKAASATVDIEVGPDVKVLADHQQMLSVIVELMSNAATAAKDHAVIHLGAGAEEQGQVLLNVRDEGPGMDHQTLTRAFAPFFSSQQAGRRRGLGLPRAKRYVESNGGRIWIQTRVNQGTTVFVQLRAPSDL